MTDLSVLLVDDDRMTHMIIDKGLANVGMKIRHALSAQEAINILKTERINLLIADIQMPGQNGISLLQALSFDKKVAEIPKIVITGQPTPEIRTQSQELGAVDFIEKPIDFDRLINSIVLHVTGQVATMPDPELNDVELSKKKQRIINQIAKSFKTGQETYAAKEVVNALFSHMNLENVSFWVRDVNAMEELRFIKMSHAGLIDMEIPVEALNSRVSGIIEKIVKDKKSILINEAWKSAMVVNPEWAQKVGLISEAILPVHKVKNTLFALDNQNTKNADVMGLIIIHSSKLITEQEFKTIDHLIRQLSSIITWIYDLYKRKNSEIAAMRASGNNWDIS